MANLMGTVHVVPASDDGRQPEGSVVGTHQELGCALAIDGGVGAPGGFGVDGKKGKIRINWGRGIFLVGRVNLGGSVGICGCKR